ncbi:hypothetical protein [Prochlorococcus marinus]|uniref:hypothetical protein n=1 Tax=Prochlorococcus marinus TaxID=1219 RepID=UPI0007B3D6D0|nr:hypothetical protein [Prochlorococcus marinus]KZR77291.1 hypothetical protein PMIT1320_00580 [Prochlorococcus marinus str. MIT 1320]
MTNPKENEEINEELSAEELKDVSAGLMNCEANGLNISGAGLEDFGLHDTQGTGSEMKIKDWEQANQAGFVAGKGTTRSASEQ